MTVLDYVNGTLESARRQADRVVTPDSRQKAYDAILSFAQERPILFVSSSASLSPLHTPLRL